MFLASLTSSISSPAALGLVLDAVGVVHQEREVVEERPPAVRAAAPDHAHVAVVHGDASRPRGARSRARRGSVSAASGSTSPSTTWSRSKSRPSRLYETQREAGGPLERRDAVVAPRQLERQRVGHGVEVAHAQHHALERAALPRALGVEERELAQLGVDAHEREGVGRLDHVHAEVVAQEGGQGIPFVNPEGHVVQAGGGEVRGHGGTSTPDRRFQSPGAALGFFC